MMVKASNENSKGSSAVPGDSGYLAGASHPLSLHPVVANQFAAFVAVTSIGFGVASQMANLMLGGMQDAMGRAAKGETPDVAPVAKEAAQEITAVHNQVIADTAPKSTKAPQRRSATQRAPVKKAPALKATPLPQGDAPKKTRVRAKANDLKRISGVGPKVEELLHKAGVKTFADIAGWTSGDVARIDRDLGLEGRILRDDWIGQAQALLKV
jgi:NADH-quinone oxidoreductase subunit E